MPVWHEEPVAVYMRERPAEQDQQLADYKKADAHFSICDAKRLRMTLVLGVAFVAQECLRDGVAGREENLVPVLPTDAPEVVTRGQVFAQRRDWDRLEAVVLPAVRLVEGHLVPGLE